MKKKVEAALTHLIMSSINLISCSQALQKKTLWQEAISSTFLPVVRKNSVNYIVDRVHAFVVDLPHT